MMKPTYLLTSLLLLALLAQGQDTTSRIHYLSAGQAADLAVQQRVEIANARLDVRNQEAYNKEITGAAYPQVKSSFNITKNFAIPVTVLPDFISPSVYGVLEQEGVKNANGDPIVFDGVVRTFPAAFGVPWTANLGVSIQQLLFQPDVFIGLKARSAAIELYENQLKVAEDSVKSNVLRTYYGVLIAQRGLNFALDSRDRLDKLQSDQGQLFKAGFIEALDLDRTRVNQNNVQSAVDNLNGLVAVSYAALKFALGVPQTDSLVLTDSLNSETLATEMMSLEEGFDYNNRSEIEALNSSNKLLQLQVQRYRLNALPTVAAFWNMQTSAQRQKFDFFDTKERWFFANLAGLNVTVPIFDGFQRKQRMQQARYALEKNDNTISQVKQGIDLQIASARVQFANAFKALQIQEANKQLADKVYATTKLKYERGLGSSFELLQTETTVQEAQNNYYQSLYNAVIARINYQRALGRL